MPAKEICVQLEFLFRSGKNDRQQDHWLRIGNRQVRLWLVRNRRARRYVLRLRPDGSARVTIPRSGGAVGARRFAERNVPWLERQLAKQLRQFALAGASRTWSVGTEILFRGEHVKLEAVSNGVSNLVRFGTESVIIASGTTDLRPNVERHLHHLAALELPARVLELAAAHQLVAKRIVVRNQRSRWGSCSQRGTISLNWRLVQTPPSVRDYIILHELAHLKEMNHSKQFWREVERLCPDYAEAERWLKANGRGFF
jgi:predicted metal-dependent hydrolase